MIFGISALLLAIVFTMGCRKGSENPDVSQVDAKVALTRFEQMLFTVDTNRADPQLTLIRDSVPALWELYFKFVLPVVDQRADTIPFPTVVEVLKAQRMRWMMDTVQTILPNLDPQMDELRSAFQYLKYYFPERLEPRVYTVVSDFSYFPFIFPDYDGRDAIGISLEMFLGPDFPYRDYTGNIPVFSNYLLRTYNRDYIARKSVEVVVDDLLGPQEGNRLLDYMIRNGKKLYLIKQLMPAAHDTIFTEYAPDKLDWVINNERNLWAHLLSNDLLYSTEFNKFQKLIQHSPNASGLPPEAPGRTANWIGYRIVEAYMKRNSGTSLRELIDLRDPQVLMDKSRYKPL